MKFKIKSYTGTVHTKRPVVKLNQFLRYVSKNAVVYIRYIVKPDEKFSDIEDLVFSQVKYLDLRSLSHFVIKSIDSSYDNNGAYLIIFVFDPDYDLPF